MKVGASAALGPGGSGLGRAAPRPRLSRAERAGAEEKGDRVLAGRQESARSRRDGDGSGAQERNGLVCIDTNT